NSPGPTGGHFDEVRAGGSEEAGSPSHRVGEERDQGRLTSRVGTPERAKAASRTTPDRITRDDLPIRPLSVTKGETTSTKGVVRGVDGALGRRDTHATAHLVEQRVKRRGSDVGHSAVPRPLGPRLRSWGEAREPVDRGASTDGLTRQECDGRVAGRDGSPTHEEAVVRLLFDPGVGEVGVPLPRLENYHSVTGLRGPQGDHASASPAPDHADIRDEFAVRPRHRGTEAHERFGYGRDHGGRSVVDALPQRVAVVLEGLGVVEAGRETLGRLEASPLRPEATRRPTLEVLLPRARVELSESYGATGQEKIGERAFDRSQEGGELLPLTGR